jgi:hypothetical protein
MREMTSSLSDGQAAAAPAEASPRDPFPEEVA